jgi:hypothetical protein
MKRLTPWLILSAALGFISSATAVPTGPTVVAFSGTAAPAGGNYSSFGPPMLNASGQVEFVATTSVSGNGIFAGTPGSLATAALIGTAAPAGGNYTNFVGTPVLNASGQVAFVAATSGSGPGIFVGTPGSLLTTVALDGTPAPAGGNYNGTFTTGLLGPAFSAAGRVAFFAGTTSANGIFAGIPGTPLSTVAFGGSPAPAGGNYAPSSSPALNALGQVAFLAGTTNALHNGIFAGTPGTTLTTVALGGDPAPAGGNFTDGIIVPTLNGFGEVAFSANTSSAHGIFAGIPGSPLNTVALEGTAAPSGGNYTGAFSAPVLNGSGQVAFSSNLTGGTSFSGIFAGSPGSLQTIALNGAATPDGVGNYDLAVNTVTLNGSGQVAFLAHTIGAGVTTANDNVLYAGSAGNAVKVVREGDIIDVDPSAVVDPRTVSTILFANGLSGQDGRGMSFNDSGLVVYRLTFTDGSSGIFTSQVAVPEPASLSLLALTGFGFLRRHRRRKYKAGIDVCGKPIRGV